MHDRRVAENSGKAAQHAILAPEDGVSHLRIRLIQPGGQADAAGYRIQFRQGEAMVGQEQVGSDDARQVVFQGRGALEVDQGRGLAAVEPGSDPRRLFASDTLSIEQIDGAIELQQHAPECFQFPGQVAPQCKWRGGDPPIHVHEQAALGKLVADEPGAVGGGSG